MRRYSPCTLAVALLGLLGLTIEAPGQGGPPGQPLPARRPTVSPYLNLLRRDQSAAMNYYTLVRPQQDTQAALNRLGQQTSQNAQAINAESAADAPLTTGHPFGFQTHMRYFLNTGSQSGGAWRSAATRRP